MLSSCRVSSERSTSGRDAWLSLTPEPERELPASVAMLRAGGAPTADAVERERARVERLVVRARSRAWLEYLREVVELIERSGESQDPQVERARSVALEVVRNHHGLLLGLPGSAAEKTAGERSRLEAAARDQTEDSNGGQ
jgi:hypothetical protein